MSINAPNQDNFGRDFLEASELALEIAASTSGAR